MRRRRSGWLCIVALALVAGACSSDGFDPDVEAQATETETPAEPTPSPEPEASPTPEVERVLILSGTVSDLLDRRDLTFTVDDVGGEIVTGQLPDVVGLVADEAVELLDDAGFVAYRTEAFPPSEDPDRVVDMWPPSGLDFALGVNVFVELDGPLDAVPVEVGSQLSGIVNGRQVLAFDPFENWLVRVWLDDPIALDSAEDSVSSDGGFDGPVTIGREVELRVPADDIVCASGAVVTDPTEVEPGATISFTLAGDPVDDIRFRAPERLTVSAITVDCG